MIMNMKYLPLVLMMGFFTTFLTAQTNQYLSGKDSDPEAVALLNKLKVKYEGFENMKMDFSLEIEIPEEDKIVQKGEIFQEDKLFHLDLEQQSVTSNGETVWIHLKNNNEVQIHNASTLEEDDSFMSPQNLLKIYESDAFIFAISNEIKQNGKVVALIECKPIDSDSEFSKLRMTVDTKNINMVSVKAFSKDGSRYTFLNNKLSSNISIPAGKFNFDTNAFPDIYVEDMREN